MYRLHISVHIRYCLVKLAARNPMLFQDFRVGQGIGADGIKRLHTADQTSRTRLAFAETSAALNGAAKYQQCQGPAPSRYFESWNLPLAHQDAPCLLAEL